MDMKGVAHVAEEGQNRQTPTTIQELSVSVDRRFDAVDRRFDDVDRRFEAVDRRFDEVDHRFEAVDAAIVEQRQYTEFAFVKLQEELVVVKSGLGRVERKLDRLIDGATFSKKPEAE